MEVTRRLERRHHTGTVEFRADDAGEGGSDQPVAAGYAAVFGRRSVEMYGFTEVIDPACFNKTVQEADVVGLWNHDERALLGRVSSGTLRLSVDDRGLAYEIDLPDTVAGRDVATLLRRKDVRGSSFGFRTIRDTWFEDADGAVTRTLLEVELIDVSPVTRPAYLDTDVALRSLARATNHDLDEVRRAAEARDLRPLLAVPGDPAPPDGPGGRPAGTATRAHIGWMHA